MSTIFISYAREDRPKAQQLAEALEGQGWDVWWDIAIPAGKKFGDVISEKLSQADVIVVLWSALSVKKDWVLDEALVGKKRSILIPVFIEKVDPPLGFGQIHAANFVGWDGSTDSSGFVRLVEDIAAIAGFPLSLNKVLDKSDARSISQKLTQELMQDIMLASAQKAVPAQAELDEQETVGNENVFRSDMQSTDQDTLVQTSNSKITITADDSNSHSVSLTKPEYRLSKRRSIGLVLMVITVIASVLFIVNRMESSPEKHPAIKMANSNSSGFDFSAYKPVNHDAAEGQKYYILGKYADAYPLLLNAGVNGNASAQYYLGVMYEKGLGVKKSDEDAVRWYLRSANQGDEIAQRQLGQMYERGFGVDQNEKEAVKWYRKAAQQGDADAQDSLTHRGLTW